MSQKKLIKKLKTLMECNIDFNIWQDNVFWLSTPKAISLQDIINGNLAMKYSGNKHLQKFCDA